MKKQNRVFHITVKKCLDCPYGAMPICDLTNDEKYDSSKIHPDCPLPNKREWLKLYFKSKSKKVKDLKKIPPKIREVMGALDAAFSGEYDLKELHMFAQDFIDHIEGVHKWKICPPDKTRVSTKLKG